MEKIKDIKKTVETPVTIKAGVPMLWGATGLFIGFILGVLVAIFAMV